MKVILYLFIFFISHPLWSQQQNRYVVYFKDKKGSNYQLDKPEAFLTSRALSRRIAQNIPITEQDLPLSEDYVAQLKAMGIPVYHRSRWLNAVLIEETEAKVNALSTLSFVDRTEFVAPGKKLGSQRISSSTQFAQASVGLQHQLLDVPLMHRLGYTGKGKLIAVFDAGFVGVEKDPKFDHLFRNQQLQQTKDFVGNSEDVFRYFDHGTKALSTMAVVDSGTFIGTAPDASFLLAVTEDISSEYIIEEFNWLVASEWADSLGADIITSSLGYLDQFDDKAMNHRLEDMDGKTTIAARAAVWATQRGMLVVNSAGNSRNDTWGTITTPADADNILAVGAIDELGNIADFSSPGPSADGRIKPDLIALGVNVQVVGGGGNYQFNNGTSFAAPQIAGLAAGVWQAFPELSNLALRTLMLQSASQFSAPGNDFGYGIPSFQLMYAPNSLANTKAVAEAVLYPNPLQPFSDLLQIKFPGFPGKTIALSIINLSGQLITKKVVNVGPSNIASLDVRHLPAGVYIMHINHDKGSSKLKLLRL